MSVGEAVRRSAVGLIALAVAISTVGMILRIVNSTDTRTATALLTLVSAGGTLAIIVVLLVWYAQHVRAMYERARHQFPDALVFTCMYTAAQQGALDRLADRVTVVRRLIPMRQYLYVTVTDGRARFYSGWLRLDLRIELSLRDLNAVSIEPAAVSEVRSIPSLALTFATPQPVVARFPVLAGNTSVYSFAKTHELDQLRLDQRLAPTH